MIFNLKSKLKLKNISIEKLKKLVFICFVVIGAEWGGGGFSDVGGARNAALYSSLHTYILHERRRERLRIGTDRIDYDYELLFALRFFSDWIVMFFFYSFLLFLTPAGVPPRQCVLVLMASWCSVSYQFCRGL